MALSPLSPASDADPHSDLALLPLSSFEASVMQKMNLPLREVFPSEQALFDALQEWASPCGYAFIRGIRGTRSGVSKRYRHEIVKQTYFFCNGQTGAPICDSNEAENVRGCNFSVIGVELANQTGWEIRPRLRDIYRVHNHATGFCPSSYPSRPSEESLTADFRVDELVQDFESPKWPHCSSLDDLLALDFNSTGNPMDQLTNSSVQPSLEHRSIQIELSTPQLLQKSSLQSQPVDQDLALDEILEISAIEHPPSSTSPALDVTKPEKEQKRKYPRIRVTGMSRKSKKPEDWRHYRSKTGCLVCRKRKIKCDEGHPSCHNCSMKNRGCIFPTYEEGKLKVVPKQKRKTRPTEELFENKRQWQQIKAREQPISDLLPQRIADGSIEDEEESLRQLLLASIYNDLNHRHELEYVQPYQLHEPYFKTQMTEQTVGDSQGVIPDQYVNADASPNRHALPGPVYCPVMECEKRYMSHGGLRYHMRHGHRNQKLLEIGDGTFSVENHEMWKLRMEEEKPYSCDNCGKRYTDRNGINYHKRYTKRCQLSTNQQLDSAPCKPKEVQTSILKPTDRSPRRWRHRKKVVAATQPVTKPVSQTCGSRLPRAMQKSARNHPLYDAKPGPRGIYHCPWEGQPLCMHQPVQLKCEYEKLIDAHLKPYVCQFSGCENSCFSSPACLYRHEREAHAMHGNGNKAFLCTAAGCERGVLGRGFPRYYNLCDHMRRVHHLSPKRSLREVQADTKSNGGAVELYEAAE